ncbi:MAG: sigma-70 family RNA polymerase sigma factor [Armatimonadota bacterium]|nr:sigma-70 family RNA polymerase sigma factor [Armatimonadota bacterium]
MAEPEDAIVRRGQAGDRDAFRTLFERYRDPVYGYIRQMVREEELATDLTQDVFLRAWEGLPRLKSPAAFRGWLYQIAANRVRDYWKSPKPEMLSTEGNGEEEGEGLLPLPDPSPGPERTAVRTHLREAVARALERLAPERREVVVLHHLRGMDVREIAKVLGVAEGTVKSRLGRARADLRRHLASWMEE